MFITLASRVCSVMCGAVTQARNFYGAIKSNLCSLAHIEGKNLALANNVRVSFWLPQNDILGHPKTRLFIGHGGMNGMLEAGYHGIPVIFMPLYFGDQFDNSVTAKHIGIGEVLFPDTITKETLVKTINMVINNQRYANFKGILHFWKNLA